MEDIEWVSLIKRAETFHGPFLIGPIIIAQSYTILQGA